MRQRTTARNLGLFFAAFVAGTALLRPAPPPPAQLRQKLELMESLGEVQAVFLGSSKTHFQFLPEAFDAEVGREGWEITSLNLGLLGAHGHEVDYLLDTLVLPLPGVRFVFIEFPGFEYQTPDVHEGTFRQIYWHDSRRTLDSITTSLRGPLDPGLRWAEVQDHVLHFVLRFLGRWPEERLAARSTDAQGYEEWLHARGARAGANAQGPYEASGPVSGEVLLRQQTRLADRGIAAFYVIPPGSPDFPEVERLAESGELKHLIRLNDPAEFPELFDREAYGTQYLLREGARRYSQALARQFLGMIPPDTPNS